MNKKAQFGFRGFMFFIIFLILFVSCFPIMKAIIGVSVVGQSEFMTLLIKLMPFVLLIFGGLYYLFGGNQ